MNKDDVVRPYPIHHPMQYLYPVQVSIPSDYTQFPQPYLASPFQYSVHYPPAIPSQQTSAALQDFAGPITGPKQTQAYSKLEEANESAQVQAQNITLRQRLKCLPLHMRYALTFQAGKLRSSKQYGLPSSVLFLFCLITVFVAIFHSAMYSIFALLYFPMPLACVVIQTSLLGAAGYGFRGPNTQLESFTQFWYMVLLYFVPLIIVASLVEFMYMYILGWIVVWAVLIVYSILLYIAPLQAAFDVPIGKSISIVVTYLLIVFAILGGIFYFIILNFSMGD